MYRGNAIIQQPVDQAKLTDAYVSEVNAFVTSAQRDKKPFFLYHPFTHVHVPLVINSRFSGTSRRGLFGDAVAEIDYSVGELLALLKKLKIEDNTFIFFSSDG